MYFHANSSGSQAVRMFGANSSLQQPSTVGHLENQMASALVLNSSSEYHFWFTTYVRYIVQEGQFSKGRFHKRQRQRRVNTAMTSMIQLPLKSMETRKSSCVNARGILPAA